MQTPPMPTPTPTPTGGPLPTQKKSLNPVFGCLIIAALPVMFIALLIGYAFFNKPPVKGVITISLGSEQSNLVPFGCMNNGSEIALPLRDEAPKNGLTVEERKLLLRDPRQDSVIPNGPIPAVTMAYVDADKQELLIGGCSRLESKLSRGIKRFRILDSRPRIHWADWSGRLEATCALSDGRTIDIDLTLTDCR